MPETKTEKPPLVPDVQRDPALEPAEGDQWGRLDYTIEVHAVKDGVVYFRRPGAIGGGKMPLAEFTEQTKIGVYLGGSNG